MLEPMERQRGRVKWFDRQKGFGFIQRDGRRDVFVHRHQIVSADRNLDRGEEVEFAVRVVPRGPVAVDLRRL